MKLTTTVFIDGTKADRHDLLPADRIVVAWGQLIAIIDDLEAFDSHLDDLTRIRAAVAAQLEQRKAVA